MDEETEKAKGSEQYPLQVVLKINNRTYSRWGIFYFVSMFNPWCKCSFPCQSNILGEKFGNLKEI